MERKIGEIFKCYGEWYQCVKDDNKCIGCSLFYTICDSNDKGIAFGECSYAGRSDETSVIFKKLEKVGEPFTIVGKLYQHYKVFDIDNVCGDGSWCVHNYKLKTLTIEIKQNKEDMEEKELKTKKIIDKLIDDYTARIITYDEFIKVVKSFYADGDESKPTLKEFDLEAAKAGKPVCTRDGRKARIVCFDRKGDMSITALITNKDIDNDNKVSETEEVHFYYENGRCNEYQEYRYDLMMLSEKKEGWVNVYKRENEYICENECNVSTGITVYKNEDEAKRNINKNAIYFSTIKINWSE